MKLEILKYPNEWLTKKLDPWDWENPPMDPIQLKKDMLKLMFDSNGIGLSANQIGINGRFFTMVHNQANYQAEREQIMINPELIEDIGPEVEMWEGCLSFPGVNIQVKRSHKIRVRWTNELNQVKEETLAGYDSVCFQHELDHLNGITFDQHVSPLVWKEAVAKAEAQ